MLIINIIITFIKIVKISCEECPIETPIKYNNQCELKYCTNSEYNEKECFISNSIIKTQWLNNIISIGGLSYKYINLYIDKHNNLIIFSYPYYGNFLSDIVKNRTFYGIKSDGGPLFYNYTLYVLELKLSLFNTGGFPNNNKFSFYDNNTNNNYFLYMALDIDYRQLYDYANFKIKAGDIMTLFQDIPYIRRYYFETSEDKNEIIIVYNDDLNNLLFKGITYSYDEEFIIFANSYYSFGNIRNTSMCSCFKITEEKKFGCFVVNENDKKFNCLILQYNDSLEFTSVLLYFNFDKIQQKNDLFYKCIHLKNKIVIFAYFIDENKLFIEIKEINSGIRTIIDFNFNITINSYFEYCDLIKISNNRFLFASTTNNDLNLFLLIFNFYNNDNNIFIRQYNISLELYNLKYYTSLRGVIFNDCIGLGFSAYKNSINSEGPFTFFTLLGYVNSTNPLAIRDLFGNKDEYIFEIKNYIRIENNLFGYELTGIQLYNVNELQNKGFKFFDSFNNNIINESIISYEINDIIIKKDQKTGILFGNYHLNFSGIASEPQNFTELIKYTYNNSFFEEFIQDDQYSQFYQPNSFIGKISNFYFSIESCYETCSECNNTQGNSNNHYCISCIEEYFFFPEENSHICIPKSVETIGNGECPENYPYLYRETNKCIKDCKIIDFLNKECILKNSTYELKQEIIKKIEEEIISNSIDEILNNITSDKGEDISIELEDIKYHITSSLRQNNYNYEDKSIIHLGECENLLKNYYNIAKNETLIIFKVDFFINSSTVPEVIYEVFEPETKQKLNLDLCEGINVEIILPGDINEENKYNYHSNQIKMHCDIMDFFNENCNLTNLSKQEIINKIGEEIIAHSIDYILNNITNDKGDDLRLDLEDIKYHISSTLRQINNDYENISTINLGECENILKREYHIDKNKTLIIFKVDLFINSSTIPVVIYEVFHPETKEKLNLTYCEGIKIEIIYPVDINEDELFKYNQSSSYYSDICWLYTSPDGTDMTIKDRQEEYINNMSLCEEDCDYSNYNSSTKKVSCQCFIKIELPIISEIKISKDKLRKNFVDIKNIVNLNVMKCYKLLFEKDGIIENIGFYILLIIIFIYTICSIYFCIKGYDILYNDVKKINIFKNSEKINKKKKNSQIIKKNKIKVNKKVIKKNNKKSKVNKQLKPIKLKQNSKSPKNKNIKKPNKVNINNIKKNNKNNLK